MVVLDALAAVTTLVAGSLLVGVPALAQQSQDVASHSFSNLRQIGQ